MCPSPEPTCSKSSPRQHPAMCPEHLVGSATFLKCTLDVRRAPMMCTSLPSFSGATVWMLSGDTTSESPSAREVAVFSAWPCEQKGVRPPFNLGVVQQLGSWQYIPAVWDLGKHGDSSPHFTVGKLRPGEWHSWNWSQRLLLSQAALFLLHTPTPLILSTTPCWEQLVLLSVCPPPHLTLPFSLHS